VRSIERAAAFVDDVGFALLFPSRGVELPSLFEATSDRTIEHLGVDWGPDTERVWGWKDELPRRGLAWYGRFLRGRPSVLSPSLLADLYPRRGRPDDFAEDPALGPDARRIAEIVLLSGPTSTAALREALDAYGTRGQARFNRALGELGRSLVVTHLGTEEQGAGWPAAVLELTARVFDVRSTAKARAGARTRASQRFLDTVLAARAHELGNTFGWGAAAARAQLDELVRAGGAVLRHPWYVRTGHLGT
jgi:hypothetical protein